MSKYKVEIEYDPNDLLIAGRWWAILRRADNWPVKCQSAFTEASARRKGRAMLRKIESQRSYLLGDDR